MRINSSEEDVAAEEEDEIEEEVNQGLRCKNLYMTKPHITLNLMADAARRTEVPKSTNAIHEKGMPGNPESHYDFYLENKKREEKKRKINK